MANSDLVTLRDGSQIRLRLGTSADTEALLAGFERLSPTSRFLRFFTGVSKLSGPMLNRLTDVDRDTHVAIAVFDPTRPSDVGTEDGLGIGVGRYIVSKKDPTVADAAVAIIDEYHGRGIGTVVLQALVVTAQERGIRTFTFDVLAENTGMASVLRTLGARLNRTVSDREELHFEVDVPNAAEPIRDTASYRVMRELARSPAAVLGPADQVQ